MVENLELQQSRDNNLSETVDTLSNAIVTPEVSEVISRFSSTSNNNDEKQDNFHPEEFEEQEKPELDQSILVENNNIESEQGLDFEHFFDGDFGQSQNNLA